MEKFREQLVEVFNSTQLPFECKFYVLKDVFNEVREVYRQQLEFTKQQQENKEEEEQNSSSSND